jgi:hypothetical protein
LSALHPVGDACDADVLSAMGAAINSAVRFDAVTNDAAIAMVATWREQLDRAFEAIEGVGLAGGRDVECFVVVISTNCTVSHDALLFAEIPQDGKY